MLRYAVWLINKTLFDDMIGL